MMYCNRNVILDFFNNMNKENIRYVLLRNINGELPDGLENGKDIDVLVNENDISNFKMLMKKDKWKRVRHPWDKRNEFVFLYAMHPLEFYEKDGIYIDVCYQLCCRSINRGEWMPLDQAINKDVWNTRIKDDEYGWYLLSNENQLVHLLTRCIFDKKCFTEGYKKDILCLVKKVDMDDVRKKLDFVFFKFTDRLIELVINNQMNEACKEYESFTDY